MTTAAYLVKVHSFQVSIKNTQNLSHKNLMVFKQLSPSTLGGTKLLTYSRYLYDTATKET